MMRISRLMLLIILCLIAQISSTHSPSRKEKCYPLLAGKKFQIKDGRLRGSTAIITFNKDSVAWRQCNIFNCKFSQRLNRVKVSECTSTKIACNDPLERPLAQAIQGIYKFIVRRGKYIFWSKRSRKPILKLTKV